MLEVVEYNVISHPGSYKFHCCKGGRKNNEKSGYCSIVGDVVLPPLLQSSVSFISKITKRSVRRMNLKIILLKKEV